MNTNNIPDIFDYPLMDRGQSQSVTFSLGGHSTICINRNDRAESFRHASNTAQRIENPAGEALDKKTLACAIQNAYDTIGAITRAKVR